MNALIQAGTDPGLVAGAVVNGQYWYRDPNHPDSGTSAINGGAVATTTHQTYTGDVSLGANTTITNIVLSTVFVFIIFGVLLEGTGAPSMLMVCQV